jgi:hypothetical protein
MSPFDIMAQDCDDVIMFINHFLKKAENEPAASTAPANNGQEKIKVNDRTATGGWW